MRRRPRARTPPRQGHQRVHGRKAPRPRVPRRRLCLTGSLISTLTRGANQNPNPNPNPNQIPNAKPNLEQNLKFKPVGPGPGQGQFANIPAPASHGLFTNAPVHTRSPGVALSRTLSAPVPHGQFDRELVERHGPRAAPVSIGSTLGTGIGRRAYETQATMTTHGDDAAAALASAANFMSVAAAPSSRSAPGPVGVGGAWSLANANYINICMYMKNGQPVLAGQPSRPP